MYVGILFRLRYPLRTKLYPSDLKTQFVPRNKHYLPRFLKQLS